MHIPSSNFLTRPTRYLGTVLTGPAGLLLMTAAAAFGIPLNAAAFTLSAPALTTSPAAASSRAFVRLGSVLAQDSDSDNDNGVSSDQLEKYIAVYRDMQRDRGLTAESAAAKESLSISQFRELEQKIERDDVAREHVRSELQAAATASPSAASTAAPSKN
jgi:hypothetical protein